jgi:beta-phosphoglucomutase
MQAVLFDFDGVVIRSMEEHFEGWRRALAEYDIDMSPEELYVLEGSGMEELANQFTRKFNLPHQEASNIIERKKFYYQQLKTAELYSHLGEVLDWVGEKGLKTALVTGECRELVVATLEKFGLMDRFQVIITADDVMFTKPSPEGYTLAAELLDVTPKDCVVIENAPRGIMSAKQAGMTCIAITSTLSRMYLKDADVIADDLTEVLTILKRMF